MKLFIKICITLLLNSLFVHTLSSQTLIQQIEDAYNALDSVSYVENIILSYKEDKLKQIREMEDMKLGFRVVEDSIQRQKMLDGIMEKYDTMQLVYREDLIKDSVWNEISAIFSRAIFSADRNLDGSIERKNIHDSIANDFLKISIQRNYSVFISRFNNSRFVLNLHIAKDTIDGDVRYSLQPDTGQFPFNIFFFGKEARPEYAVLVKNGKYEMDEWYGIITLWRADMPKAFERIMRKNPQYLLHCYELEQMDTILYVLNDKIFVYRIREQEEFELSDYIKRFGLSR